MINIVVIEGLDVSGKHTLAQAIKSRVLATGNKAKIIEFPRYDTDLGAEIRRALVGKRPQSASALFEEDRARYVRTDLANDVAEYDVLIFDRLYFSNYICHYYSDSVSREDLLEMYNREKARFDVAFAGHNVVNVVTKYIDEYDNRVHNALMEKKYERDSNETTAKQNNFNGAINNALKYNDYSADIILPISQIYFTNDSVEKVFKLFK